MKTLVLGNIFIQNFRSYKKESVKLSDSIGLKLFSGQNLSEPRLGANGSGKSSFWEALVWCLYGSGIKGSRTSAVLSWNQSLIEVLVELTVNKTTHSIYRSGPPNKIELNGQVASQEDLDELIGLSKERFLHSVVFGQGVPLFPDLTIPQRGELLDGVLNLGIWQSASDSAGKKCSVLDKQLQGEKENLSYIEGQLNQLQKDEYIQGQLEYWEESHQEEVVSCKKKLTTWESARTDNLNAIKSQEAEWKQSKEKELQDKAEELDKFERELITIEDALNALPESQTRKLEDAVLATEQEVKSFRQTLTKLQTKHDLIVEPRDFWTKNNTCPQCKQPITPAIKATQLGEILLQEHALIEKITSTSCLLKDSETNFSARKADLLTVQIFAAQQAELRHGYQRDVRRLKTQITAVESTARLLVKEIEANANPFAKQIKRLEAENNPFIDQLASLEKKPNPYVEMLQNNKNLRQELEVKKEVRTTEIELVQSSIVASEYWKHGFKRIRLYFVQRVLAALQIEIQSALSALGLDKWAVGLSTESETKSGTTKLGVQIHIKSPIAEGTWDVWSGGESQRLRLAIAMGLASLIQRAAGVFFTFETWDEPTAWLGSEGVEDLLQALQYRAESLNKSIWIVDHRALQFSGFNEIWLVSKEKNGSSISLLTGEAA